MNVHGEQRDGLVVELVDPKGDVHRFDRDGRGNLLFYVDPTGAVTSFRHDARGLVTESVSPTGETTTYAYDPQGNFVEVTLPNGDVYRFTYDSFGRRGQQVGSPRRGDLEREIATRAFDGVTERFLYDELGDLVHLQGAGIEVGFERDAKGRFVRETVLFRPHSRPPTTIIRRASTPTEGRAMTKFHPTPLHPLRIPTGWQVIYNNLCELDPMTLQEPADSRWIYFEEDIFAAQHNYYNATIDIGWYPAQDFCGAYQAILVINDAWEKPEDSLTTKNLRELVQWVEERLANSQLLEKKSNKRRQKR